jgi:hypothetical protein
MKEYIPQIIVICLYFGGLLVAGLKHGKSRENYNFWSTLAATILSAALLKWGGFF